jgi:hypothetical protein
VGPCIVGVGPQLANPHEFDLHDLVSFFECMSCLAIRRRSPLVRDKSLGFLVEFRCALARDSEAFFGLP